MKFSRSLEFISASFIAQQMINTRGGRFGPPPPVLIGLSLSVEFLVSYDVIVWSQQRVSYGTSSIINAILVSSTHTTSLYSARISNGLSFI